jgi:hypothetical protein
MLSPLQRLAILAVLVLILSALPVGVWLILHHEPPPSTIPNRVSLGSKPAELVVPPPKLLEGPTPDLVLMITGEMHGYLQPCGCARPQLGGLERRCELLKQLKAKGWAVSAIDLGDMAPAHATDQSRIKFETALKSLQLMNYAAMGLGQAELTLPLDQTLGIAINYQPPAMLAANLNDKEERFPEMFKRWTVDQPKPDGLKVGYIGIVGEPVADAAKKKDASLQFDPIDPALAKALKELNEQNPDLVVLAFLGSRDEAKAVVAKHPGIRLVLTMDISDEPSAVPEKIGDTWFLSLGHKSKYVGLLGVYKNPLPPGGGGTGRGGVDLKYQLVTMSPHFELPKEETNPVREQMRDYVLRVHNGNFLARWPKGSHPVQVEQPEAKYVGAQACKDCHKSAYGMWSQSRHAQAYESLVKKGEPVAKRERKGQEPLLIGRQFDPDCVRCHTTGFDYKTGFVDESTTKHLLGNQCENCHGPSSLHVADPKNPTFYKPLHLSVGPAVELQLCRKCHDTDNDPKFNMELYWPKVKHGKD